MKRGDLKLSDFFKFLSSQKFLTYRAVVYCRDNTWLLHTAYIINAVPKIAPMGFFAYGDVGFLVMRISGRVLANALQSGKLVTNSNEFVIPKLQSNARFDRFPSHTARYWQENTFPFTLFHVGFAERDVRLNEFDPLIARGLPSFPDLKTAVFFYLYEASADRDMSLSNDIVLHINHRESWIDKIYLEPNSISIAIKGRVVKNTRLEVWVGGQHGETFVKKPGRVKFSLNAGLQDKIWIVASRNKHWLDYREIDLRYRSYSSKEDKNLIIKNRDAQVELKGIIARGEGETTEFKFRVPLPAESLKLTKTVAAFANGSGGIIFIGVDDSGGLAGVAGNLNQENVRLSQMIRENLTHQPAVKIYDQVIDGVSLLVAEISKGETPPYGVGRSNPRYYVRRGATTFPATPDEIRLLVHTNESERLHRSLGIEPFRDR